MNHDAIEASHVGCRWVPLTCMHVTEIAGVVFLTAQQGQFSRGHEDTFLYPRLPYLGQLYQLRIGNDGSGMFAAWHLTRVEVVHVHSGQSWVFDCHDWIDRRCCWQKLLPAISTSKP